MHAYVINLARSTDRRAHMVAELRNANLDYEFVDGIDGAELDLHDPATIDPALFDRSQWPAGMAGCALSHLRIYQKMITDGLDTALVLEDDVTLPGDLNGLADALVEHLAGAELVLLNYDSKDSCKMSREGAVDLPGSRRLVLPIDIRQPGSSAGYVITREAAKRMSDSVLPVRVSPDDWWFFYREGALDRVRCVTPLPVAKSARFESTIGLYGLGKGIKGRLLEPLVRRKVPVLHQAISYRRQLIYRQMTRSELVDTPFVEKPSRLG
ncbi:MAG TPA: glycosyltransferase family 25 protein [Streptosporangiaceae bacterium]|nr:glycosyltransferase family 25 protein [Streptosporangiaceae bacterium]